MKEGAREYSIADLRGENPRPIREVSRALELFDISERQPLRKSANGPIYEEICTPSLLTNWKIGHGKLSSWIEPDQDVCNEIPLEIARGDTPNRAIFPT